MGYYTEFKILKTDPMGPSMLFGALADKSGYSSDVFNGYETAKWYDHEADIKAVMLSTGCTFLLLRGDGEDRDDHWEKEFRLVDGVVTIQTFKLALTRVP
jgi:hypothetical protein